MKTLDFLNELTGRDFTKENTNNKILREIRDMLGLRRQIEDDEAFDFLSSLSFKKMTVDRSNNSDFLVNYITIFYAEKDDYKLIIACSLLKNGSSNVSIKWSNKYTGKAEGEIDFYLKHHNLDIIKIYRDSNNQEDTKEEPIKTTTIKELAKELNLSESDFRWELANILRTKEISNDLKTFRFEIIKPKGSRSEVVVKEIINK